MKRHSKKSWPWLRESKDMALRGRVVRQAIKARKSRMCSQAVGEPADRVETGSHDHRGLTGAEQVEHHE